MTANREFASTFLSRLARQTRGEFADIRMVCHDETWHVHRVVLIAHSYKLEQLVTQSSQEGEDPEIDLSDEYPHCVQALFEYLYAFDYNVPESDQWADAEFHTEMCILAHKYAIFDLKKLAIKNFVRAVKSEATTNDVLAETAGLAWGEPAATTAIRDEIVKEALTRDDLLWDIDGETSKFELVMLRRPELAVTMAKVACAKDA